MNTDLWLNTDLLKLTISGNSSLKQGWKWRFWQTERKITLLVVFILFWCFLSLFWWFYPSFGGFVVPLWWFCGQPSKRPFWSLFKAGFQTKHRFWQIWLMPLFDENNHFLMIKWRKWPLFDENKVIGLEGSVFTGHPSALVRFWNTEMGINPENTIWLTESQNRLTDRFRTRSASNA